jgi:alpha-mannosidase
MTVIDGKPGEADLAAFGLRYTTSMPSIAATVKEGATRSCLFPMSTEGSSVQITAIKRDEAGTLIVRAYESCGQEQKIRLPDGMRAMEVDPLEEKELSAILDVLVFRPFEIKTVRIVTPDTEL